jgi:hypothetical protein
MNPWRPATRTDAVGLAVAIRRDRRFGSAANLCGVTSYQRYGNGTPAQGQARIQPTRLLYSGVSLACDWITAFLIHNDADPHQSGSDAAASSRKEADGGQSVAANLIVPSRTVVSLRA